MKLDKRTDVGAVFKMKSLCSSKNCSINQVKATALKKSHVMLGCRLDTDAEAADSAQRTKKPLLGQTGKKNTLTERKTQVNLKTKLRRGGGSATVDTRG